MTRWRQLAQAAAATPVLLASLTLMLAFSVLMNAPGLPTSGARFEQLAGVPVFDFRFDGYDLAALREALARAGAEGRQVYQRFMLLDLAFPAVYAMFWIGLLQRLEGASGPPWHWAPGVPALTALVDYGENLFIAGAVLLDPDAPASLVRLASACTQAKLLATAGLLATVAVVLLRRAFLLLRSRRRDGGGR